MATAVHDQPGSPTDARIVELMSYPAARRFLGIGQRALDRLVSSGTLTVRSVPGSYPKVVRAEVEALARQYTKIGHGSSTAAT